MSVRGYVGVVGPGRGATPELVQQAVEVGRLLAAEGFVVVTGGLGGVMAGAARGCAEAGGTSLGLLPGPDRGLANPHLTLTIPTGLGEMRNALLVRASQVVVAVGSSWGTLSEIALARRTGVPVVLLDAPQLLSLDDADEEVADGDVAGHLPGDVGGGAGGDTGAGAGPGSTRRTRLVHVTSPQEAVERVVRLLPATPLARTAASASAGSGASTTSAGSAGEGWVLGVDASRGGWVGALLPVSGTGTVRLLAAHDIRTLVDRATGQGEIHVVAVDTPIGLPDDGPRRADALARRRLGRRASSVFSTPVRDALAAPTYAEARAVSVERTGGTSLTAQSYGLRRAILDVDDLVRSGTRLRVVEVHPELSFARMAGEPLLTRKRQEDGAVERLGVLRAQGIRLPASTDVRTRDVHDLLDAAAAAWSAARVARGEAESLPDPPQRFSDGLEAAIRV